MMNQYPLWKNLLILGLILVGILYAIPNLYGDDPAIQISAKTGIGINEAFLEELRTILDKENLTYKTIELEAGKALLRFRDTDTQLRANDLLRTQFKSPYTVAQNLAPAVPDWLRAFNARPMYLGLDLRGGVHLLIEVDMQAAVFKAYDRYAADIRGKLRKNKVRYLSVRRMDEGGIRIKFRNTAERDTARTIIKKEFKKLVSEEVEKEGIFLLKLNLNEAEQREVKNFALEQNLTTLRNRVNELGVAEPIIQRQGTDRIVVQLPGVQDSTRMRDILGATATLEFRIVDEGKDANAALANKRAPAGTKLYKTRDGRPLLLKRAVIITGEYITNAASGIASDSGSPAVFITLDAAGARIMSNETKTKVGQMMGVVFIEKKVETVIENGVQVKKRTTIEEVINTARIQERLAKRFQIHGLDSTQEARDLALLLRAGALAAPIEIIEERTVGPSMGQDNINQGFKSVVIGFAFVLVFMALYYKLFGVVADVALLLNLVLVVALLSMLQATLTLPGIAGIVLTIGMAVDANVLINERIREELRNGNTPQASIHAGYERAFATIADANITTLIAAVVLFAFGTGPIKGFAVTLSLGIVTSMFTAVMGTRAVINLVYGGKRVKKLFI